MLCTSGTVRVTPAGLQRARLQSRPPVPSSPYFLVRARQAECEGVRTERHATPGLLNAALTTAAAVVLALGAPQPSALAVPQTSACATEACDGQDLSNKDLTQEFYTKGSLKGTNFSNSDLSRVTLFGADLTNANLEGANLEYANLGTCNLSGANLKNARLEGAILSSARLEKVGNIENSDWTDVILRKDVNDAVCKLPTAKGVNPTTGVDTRESLFCPPL